MAGGRPAARSEGQELREALARATTLREAAKAAQARAVVDDVARRARELGDGPLVVAALLERARCRLDPGEYPAAE